MNNQYLFSLYELVGAALIVQIQTGVVYTNQTGGTACLQPTAEGALLPINNEFDYSDPDDSIEHKLGQLLEECGRLTVEEADQLDALLARYPQTDKIRADRDKLKESHEAWIHVIVDNSLWNAQGETNAILTWPNSD